MVFIWVVCSGSCVADWVNGCSIRTWALWDVPTSVQVYFPYILIRGLGISWWAVRSLYTYDREGTHTCYYWRVTLSLCQNTLFSRFLNLWEHSGTSYILTHWRSWKPNFWEENMDSGTKPVPLWLIKVKYENTKSFCTVTHIWGLWRNLLASPKQWRKGGTPTHSFLSSNHITSCGHLHLHLVDVTQVLPKVLWQHLWEGFDVFRTNLQQTKSL